VTNSPEYFKFAVHMDRLPKVFEEASRLKAVREVAEKIRAGFETHSRAPESERVPGVIYSFPPDTLDFNMQIGSARLIARFVATTDAEDRGMGRRNYAGRYVFELLPIDRRETVGKPIFAVSFDHDSAIRPGDFAGDGSDDLNIENERDLIWMFFTLTEANIFANLYPSLERYAEEQQFP